MGGAKTKTGKIDLERKNKHHENHIEDYKTKNAYISGKISVDNIRDIVVRKKV